MDDRVDRVMGNWLHWAALAYIGLYWAVLVVKEIQVLKVFHVFQVIYVVRLSGPLGDQSGRMVQVFKWFR